MAVADMSVPRCAECGVELPTDLPWTVEVQADGTPEVALRGVIGNYPDLRAFADAVKPLGLLVLATPMLHHHHDPGI
jgi:hypothetical protein